MANTTISPNMNMPVPVVSVDPGPDWATNVDSCLSIIDSHNHTAGQGVPIPTGGININADLPINNFNITTVRSLRFAPQGAPLALGSDLGCLYESGVDLYYNDGNGNQVRLTNGGSPAGATGTITGLPSGTASASFSGTTFTFQSSTNTPASLAVGPTKIAQAVANGKGVTFTPNVAQAADYGLTLPIALPSITSLVTSSSVGTMAFSGYASSTFTTTVSNVQNIVGSSNVRDLFYTRLGNLVTCFGSLDVQVLNGALGVFRLSLPIATTMAAAYNLQGQGSAAVLNTPMSMQIYGAPATNTAECAVFGDGNSNTVNYCFQYQVI